jgi:hypothetical protein
MTRGSLWMGVRFVVGMRMEWREGLTTVEVDVDFAAGSHDLCGW